MSQSIAGDGESPPSEAPADEEPAELVLGPFDNHGTTRTRYRGRLIEVEHGIPGERVLARITEGKRPRGHILEVLEPDPSRVEAPCVYFRDWACGGCQWQMIAYQSQVERKVAELDRAMDEADVPLAVMRSHTLDEPWRYRGTAGIALGKRAGFRRHGSLAIVPIRDCPISHPLIGELMAVLNDRLDAGALPDFRGRVRLDVRLTGIDEQKLQVLVRPDFDRPPDPDALQVLIETLIGLELVSGLARVRPGGGINTVSGDLFARTMVAGREVVLATPSFFQTNLRLLPALIDRLCEEASPLEGKRVADVYGGVGIFGLFMAEATAEVTVIESDALAVEAGKRTAAAWGLNNVRFITGTAEEALASGDSYDVVIVDPPRSGLSAEVLAALAESTPPVLLYVSCLAQSLAHDLRELMGGGYRVDGLELFDFYPQTYHIEALAVLRME